MMDHWPDVEEIQIVNGVYPHGSGSISLIHQCLLLQMCIFCAFFVDCLQDHPAE